MFKLELLSRTHDRESFDCGVAALNSYLRQTARQHIDRGISRTFVLVADESAAPNPILGFFTLNLCQVKADQLPADQARKFPREIPGIKLGRLAVSSAVQGQGLGKILLIGAMRKVLEIYYSAGGIGMFVDAKDRKAALFYERFGFIPTPANPLLLFLPVETVIEVLRGR